MNTNLAISLGDYHIRREAGRGAMATVYEAESQRDGSTVALKMLSAPAAMTPEDQRALVARLQREARLIAGLSHPNIVRILDVGESEGRHYIVMEYLQGTTLRERLDRGPLPLVEASYILDQVADALDVIHAQQITHRDIKPSNVMLTTDGRVKLMDFGVARQGDDTAITQAGMIIGSPAYMSPEQIRGESGDPASDLWALGILLYEMLSGKSPFPGTNIPAVLYKVTHDPPPPIPGISNSVQQVLRKALEKNPERRYRSAGDFAEALRTVLYAVPVARGVRTWPRLALPAAAALALILGLAGLVWLTLPHRRTAHTPFRTMTPTVPSTQSLSASVPAPPDVSITEHSVARPQAHTPRKPAKPTTHKTGVKHPVKHIVHHSAPRHRIHSRAHRRVRHVRQRTFYWGSTPDYGGHVPFHPVYNPQSPG